ncbi:hypothetical protein EDB92DRAFT_136210 [Lactarius akahatsu]|uniref:Uncharacterized protein n=1 Tax=Lactarius akahatsu TaxID=416441 RepID=A0AAD4Q8Z9_9AGAM|nr:hypothetical protein EDB92DRAFT_136210 [Lactarius akahatsu]
MNPHAQHLLIDGYIASTFGPQPAEAYHCTLLRREPRFLQPENLPGYPGTFFAVPPHRPDLNPHQPQTLWAIDQAVRNQGTVIRQQIWVPRNQHGFLCPPIFFFHRNGGLGLPLNQAAGGNCMSLQGASQPAPLGDTCSTHAEIRINWHGYSPWSGQILIRTQGQGQEIIRLEKFVMHVARKVQKFMTLMTEARQPYNNGEQRWYIGAGGITPDGVTLIGVVHVSQGSWMPILQLNHFVF